MRYQQSITGYTVFVLIPLVVGVCTACTRPLPPPGASALGGSETTSTTHEGNDAIEELVPTPIAVTSVGEHSNFAGWKLPAPLCLAGAQSIGALEDIYGQSPDKWIAAGKYELAGLDYYIVSSKVSDELPIEVTVGHWKLLDGWSANAPSSVLTRWQDCGPKACMVSVKVGDPFILIVVHGKWDINPAYALPLTGVAETAPPWLMFREGKAQQWSNGELTIPSYGEFKAAIQKAFLELAATGDCSAEYLPPGYVKPSADLPDAGAQPPDVNSGWQLKDAQLPPDSGGKKGGASEASDAAAQKP